MTLSSFSLAQCLTSSKVTRWKLKICNSALGTSFHLMWASLFKAKLPNAWMPREKHLWQIFHLNAWIVDTQGADLYSVTCLYAIYLANWLPLANHYGIIGGLALTPHFWCAVSGILCHWELLNVVRQSSFKSPTCILVHPNDGDHGLVVSSPWGRPLDNLSLGQRFSHITVEGIAK